MKDDRGDNDLEVVIDKLTKQKELLQFQCRKAGDTISGYKLLIEEQKKEIWELKKILHQDNEKNKNLLQGYKNVIEDLSIKLSQKIHESTRLSRKVSEATLQKDQMQSKNAVIYVEINGKGYMKIRRMEVHENAIPIDRSTKVIVHTD